MYQFVGEIRLFPYGKIPVGWLRCDGQSLHISKYPKLYMLIGTTFGKEGEYYFSLPNLLDITPQDLTYCIAIEGIVPQINS